MQKLNYDQKIIAVLTDANEPTDVEKIRVRAGIGHWNTTLKHCLELLIAKRINGTKTSKSWIFWVEKEAQP